MTRLLLLIAVFGWTATAAAQTPRRVEAETIVVENPPHAVTVYVGRASVTRSAIFTLPPGVYVLEFASLPETVQPGSLQARVEGPAQVLGVEYEERLGREAASPQIAQLDARIEETRLAIDDVAERVELIEAEQRFLDAVSIRAAADASDKGGTNALDLDVVKEQLAFVREERARLLAARRELDTETRELEQTLGILEADRASIAGDSSLNRTAAVSIVVPNLAEVTVNLSYLVIEANWSPAYNVRAAQDGSSVVVEYDAVVLQRTGEDWTDVKLVLSTAQPTLAADPPPLDPWFVDKIDPSLAATAMERRVPAAAAPRRATDAATLEGMAADARVAGSGPSVTYELPRLVTIRSTTGSQQRTRIASIDAAARFVYVAVPPLTEAVYIRGDLVNTSDYQLLPGEISIFVGPDYVGPTMLPGIAPRGRFKLYFGIDRAVTARRTLVTKKSVKTGLLGGGRKTSYDYRIAIENATGKAVDIEVWDRYPVSRASEIQIELVDLSLPLAADAEYLEEDEPQGLLKWTTTIPPNATGPAAFVLTYGVRVNRGKDVEMTPLPE